MNSNKNHYKINNNYINSDISTKKIDFIDNYPDSNYDNEESIILTLITIIIGILLGIVIGYFIFRDIKYIGPDSNEIVKNIYIDDKGHKYKYKPRITICPLNYSMDKLHDVKFKEIH